MGLSGGWWARVAYGALFVIGVPALGVLLAVRVRTPWGLAPQPALGGLLLVAGLALLAAGVWGIVRHGRGLPMNAFPPPELVTTGAYALVPHPIYVGFVLACAGAAWAVGSASGLFVATPVAALGCLALVLGHERISLLTRFGRLPEPLLGLGRLAPLARAIGLARLSRAVLDATAQLANAWRSWCWGRLRVINHVVYSGLAGGVGAAAVVLASGAAAAGWVAGLMLAGALGAAAIGQLMVGSSARLSRPFGYFGGLVAIGVLGGAAWMLRPEVAVVLAGFCLAAPWTQAIGRLRCLVQGCCHGAPAPAASGIVVTNAHSRVCSLSPYGGVPIHATQLYSIVGNLILGPVLLVLWSSRVPVSLVMGAYLVGAGVVRFIEEAYRGEPLTKVVGGLRLYQWLAVGMVVAGCLVMVIESADCPSLSLADWPVALALGSVFFVVCGAVMSVDAPESGWRFSRLSG